MHDIAAGNFTQTPAEKNVLRPNEAWRGIKGWLAGKYNRLHRALRPPKLLPARSQDLQEIRERALVPGDIDEHLELMFTEALLLRPQLIVELGVRGGVSTFVFERVARRCKSSIVSVDIDDCSDISTYERWHFVQADDVQFAAKFPDFCRQGGIGPSIDLLFIDTSHYYEPTVQEIRAWFPLLSTRAKVILHDTNLRVIGPREDGTIQLSWDNERGVIRALEEYLGIRVDESGTFQEVASGWLIRHWPNCNGLTILDRMPS
jgi:cephalosporin hydroxylase